MSMSPDDARQVIGGGCGGCIGLVLAAIAFMVFIGFLLAFFGIVGSLFG